MDKPGLTTVIWQVEIFLFLGRGILTPVHGNSCEVPPERMLYAPSRNPLGSDHILPYIPPLVLIGIQYCQQCRNIYTILLFSKTITFKIGFNLKWMQKMHSLDSFQGCSVADQYKWRDIRGWRSMLECTKLNLHYLKISKKLSSFIFPSISRRPVIVCVHFLQSS